MAIVTMPPHMRLRGEATCTAAEPGMGGALMSAEHLWALPSAVSQQAPGLVTWGPLTGLAWSETRRPSSSTSSPSPTHSTDPKGLGMPLKASEGLGALPREYKALTGRVGTGTLAGFRACRATMNLPPQSTHVPSQSLRPFLQVLAPPQKKFLLPWGSGPFQ